MSNWLPSFFLFLSQTKLVFYLESLNYTSLNPLNLTLSIKKSQTLSFSDILCRETSKLVTSNICVKHNHTHIDPFIYLSFTFSKDYHIRLCKSASECLYLVLKHLSFKFFARLSLAFLSESYVVIYNYKVVRELFSFRDLSLILFFLKSCTNSFNYVSFKAEF